MINKAINLNRKYLLLKMYNKYKNEIGLRGNYYQIDFITVKTSDRFMKNFKL